MSEPIRAATSTQAFYLDNREVERDSRPRAYRVQDKVEFSKEALEKLKSFRPEEYRISPETGAAQDPDLQKSLNTLKLQSGATPLQIKKAYIEAIKQYHPDNYSTMPSEFQKLAEEKTKEINSAYYKLKKAVNSEA